LLPFTRRELQEWVDRRTLPVHADPANEDPRHDRSWLRWHLLPDLRRRFGDVDERLLEVAADAARHRRAWSALLEVLPDLIVARADGYIEVARPPLQRYHKVLSEALLRAAAREVGCRVGLRRGARLLRFSLEGRSGRSLELGEGWRAELIFDRVRIVRAAEQRAVGGRLQVRGDEGTLRFGGWQLRWRIEPAGRVERRGLVTWAPPHLLAIRAWQPGDRMVPLGGVGRRKVRRLLMEARVPFQERRTYPLLVRGEEILWVPGVCRSAVAIPDTDERALRLEAIQLGPQAGNTVRSDGY
ncbi:MAG: tRNA lysidine(34) synthetase TilS, partial [Gemmatimonadales bacterium]|nr:tRNA lysidine(34) synthetase TilS [Gemmatimonadales bacterium]